MSLAFPDIDPVLLQIGPLAIRWYSCAYIAGLLGGWYQARAYTKKNGALSQEEIDDFLTWAVLGIILGGRIGYVLFYNFDFYIHNPLKALQIWKGGMSFHGGLLGMILSSFIFTKIKKRNFLALGDLVACCAPIGIFLGRLTNFINGELYGRPATDVPWAIRFPAGGSIPRHPSQIYEALLEGLAVFIIINFLWRCERIRNRKGFLSGMFFILYAVFRIFIENYREPDAHIGFLFANITMGQLLCLPMALFGILLIFIASKKAVFITDETFLENRHIRHGFFTRNGGVSKDIYKSLNCGLASKDKKKNVKTNIKRIKKELFSKKLLLINQCHTNKVITVEKAWKLEDRPDADAVVTDKKNLILGIVTADCAPVLFADMENNIIGAAHAGWKGALSGIIRNTIKAMCKIGAEKKNIVAIVGPCIAQKSYEVDETFFQTFIKESKKHESFFEEKENGKYLFDLSGFVRSRLSSAGIKQIKTIDKDTYAEEEDFFSYRRTTHRKEKDYARQLSAICLKKP